MAELHRLEVWIRRNVRDRFRRSRAEVTRAVEASADIFEPGSVLLLPGELQRHDFSQLMELRRRLRLSFAFLFYDLLETLSNDDPRARDLTATDIPGTEFILREAFLVLPISHYSEGELRRHAASRKIGLPPIKTIRLGHQVGDTTASCPVDGLVPGQFVLTVGDVTPRKNHRLLVDIWRTLALKKTVCLIPLVIAGRVGTDGEPLVSACNADPDTAQTVKFLSNVDDSQLTWLYQNCRFTLFPSLSEGFGLPVVESLAFGKPCIASNATSIPEASQGIADHIDPNDQAAWEGAITRLLGDDEQLAQAKQEIAGRFRLTCWDQTASDVLTAIDCELR